MRTYSLDEARERVRTELPAWRIRDGRLERVYATGEWTVTLLAAGAVAFLAEAAFHHPDLELAYDRLTVRLETHEAGGLTDRDFLLARRVEEVLGWRPGPPFPRRPGVWIEAESG